MRRTLLALILLLFISCSGQKIEVKPEKNESLSPPVDTLNYSKPKQLFPEQIGDSQVDSVIIPKRPKQEKTPQIILAPVVIPIVTSPTLITEQPSQLKQVEIQKPPEQPKPEPPPEKPEPEIVEKKSEPVKLETFKTLDTLTSEFYIQIGAFITEENATKLLQKFQKLFPSRTAHIFYDPSDKLYKVRFNGAKDSLSLARIINETQRDFPDAFIAKEKVPKQSPQSDENTAPIKLQISVLSNYERAETLKNYIQKKFGIRAEILKNDELFKIICFIEPEKVELLDKIKEEFPDAFVVK